MKSYMICAAHHVLFCQTIEENTVGGTDDTFGGEEKYIQRFAWDLKNGRIILKWGFKNKMGWLGLDLNEGQQQRAGCCASGYERCGFVICGQFFFYWERNCQLLRKDFLNCQLKSTKVFLVIHEISTCSIIAAVLYPECSSQDGCKQGQNEPTEVYASFRLR